MAGRGAGHDGCRSRRRPDGFHHRVDDRPLDTVVRDRWGIRARGVALRLFVVLSRCDVRVRGCGSPSSSSPASGTPSAEAAAPPAPAEPAPADDLVAALDRARAAAGCDPLSTDGTLTEVAREHSATMRDDDFLGLVDGNGDSVLDEADAEAGWVARGTSAAGVVSGWLSQDDAATLQDCSLTTVGIGRVGGADGPWWTVLLA